MSLSKLSELLLEFGGKFGTGESLTGGMIANFVVENGVSSDVFAGGIVSYSNEVKMRMLGVKKESLDEHTAVSDVVVQQMAQGVCSCLGILAGLACTGIAGPTGGMEGKPVGTVFIGTCVDGDVRSQRCFFDTDRLNVRIRTQNTVLKMLVEHLEDYKKKKSGQKEEEEGEEEKKK